MDTTTWRWVGNMQIVIWWDNMMDILGGGKSGWCSFIVDI